jgi:16S rRNA (uracil1498-N3)-methyltransferase
VNLLLLFPEDRVGDTWEPRFRVQDGRARHVREVLGLGPGDTLRVGLLEGPVGTATIEALDGAGLELLATLDGEPPPRPTLDLVLAIPRPKTLKKLLPEVTALGVDRLTLLRTWRVAQPYLGSPLLSPEGHRPLLFEGMMQALTTHEPKVEVEPRFRPFVEDRAPERFAGHLKLVAHPYAATPLASLDVPADARVALAVGPEGGLIPEELASFERAGFVAVSSGPRVLRVETACVALLAQIDLLRRRGPR